MRCMKCNIVLKDVMQYYNLGDVGTELIAIIARTLNCEIDHQANLCEECFSFFTHQLPIEAKHNSTSHCICCERSIIGLHSHSLPDGPERDEIAVRILPRQIQPRNRVCYACWLAAYRNVKKSLQQDQNRVKLDVKIESEDQPSPLDPQPSTSYSPVCSSCERSIARRHSHSLPEGPERECIASRKSPRQIEPNGRVCYACWLSARRYVRKKAAAERNTSDSSNSLTVLHNYKRSGNSANTCFVHKCTNVKRLTVPTFLRYRLLKSHKMYVTENARVCHEHLSTYNWDFLNEHGYINRFTSAQVEEIMNMALENR